MTETRLLHCFECGDELKDLKEAYYIGGDEYICENCRDYYIYCEDCENLVHETCIVSVDDGDRYVCENCADDYYVCDRCGELYSEVAVNNYDFTLCDYCYNEYYFTCESCGDVYYIDDGEYINGYYYCYNCADEYQCIRSYTFKPIPRFYGGYAGYGVELEIDNGDDRLEAARAIQAAGGEHIYIKEDGSLSYGMEIVTHPATLEYHVQQFPWEEICRAALSHGFRSHDTNTCGLHIHASRPLFGESELEQDLTIAKIMLLFDRWYDSYILRFSRRNIDNIKRWADKPNADIRPEDNEAKAIYKSKRSSSDRYKAINLCNYHTVEFRIFKGTLKKDTIIASIQWVDTLIHYCRNTTLKDLFNTSWDEIFANTGHAELTAYLKKRGLYNLKEVDI